MTEPGQFAPNIDFNTQGGFNLFEAFTTDSLDSFNAPEMGEDGLSWNGDDYLFPDATPRNQYEPLDPEKMPQINAVDQHAPEYAERPAEERTRELFAYMRPHRLSLLGIVDAARTPITMQAMEQVVDELHARKFNVYSTANLCTMLETAGALERVTEDGTPFAQFVPTPDIVVIDGEDYWKPSDPPAVCWQATDAGLLMVEENDPVGRMREVLRREGEFADIYKQVLSIIRNGASISELSAKVDSNPRIATPRRFFVQHFVEGLERCEAVGWEKGRWAITPVGEEILGTLLADVEAAPEYAQQDRGRAIDGIVPTETQGVNW